MKFVAGILNKSMRRVPRYNASVPKPDKPKSDNRKLYDSNDWRHGIRPIILNRDPICKICHAKPSTDVDHIVDIKDAPHLARDLENLRGLCHECHSKKTWETHKER